MSCEVVLRAVDLAKCFRIFGEPMDRLRQVLSRDRVRHFREFWALQDVSFEVCRGEAVGIVGRNGSGKSTLLQLIAGTMTPTAGTVWTEGRIAALLELGAGFNPEFSGRENVYLSGSILGFSRAEIAERFDAIAGFADIGGFLDTPVKTYSSGMFVRLAFAVQIQLRPDILIVDEALSVGDMFFQAKCLAALRKLMDDGLTLLFVSHSLEMVRATCSRAIALERGRMVASGRADDVCQAYVTRAWSETRDHPLEEHAGPYTSGLQPTFAQRLTERTGNGLARFEECAFFERGAEVDRVFTGDTLTVCAWLRVHRDIPEMVEIGLVVATIYGTDVFAANSRDNGLTCGPFAAGDLVRVDFEFKADLVPGLYAVSLGVKVPVQGPYADKVYTAGVFEVEQSAARPLYTLVRVPSRIAVRKVGT